MPIVNKGDVGVGVVMLPIFVEPLAKDGSTLDISSGVSDMRMKLVSPSGVVTAFNTGVSVVTKDGKNMFKWQTPASNISSEGTWIVQVEYSRNGVTGINTMPAKFKVYTDYEPAA